MCFIEKRNCIRIRKRDDRIPDPVHTPSWVGYWGGSSRIMSVLDTHHSSRTLSCSLKNTPLEKSGQMKG